MVLYSTQVGFFLKNIDPNNKIKPQKIDFEKLFPCQFRVENGLSSILLKMSTNEANKMDLPILLCYIQTNIIFYLFFFVDC
jgi:hypothetical protein